jgi:hypothetical protein
MYYDTVSKGEGIFDNFLFLPLPLRIKVRGHYVVIFMLGLISDWQKRLAYITSN